MKKRSSRAEEEPPLKRPKVTRGEDDYVPGNIIEVELCNFMTYEYFCCKPGSRLNLVMGPNGSGKSSIVCAIALGLGGEPQLLGRATSIGAYVKRGKESGYVKISLRGGTEEEKLVITRKMDTCNKSKWMLNGRVVTKREIVEITERFNIQVNNLTQFLPQDRVCEFAKLTPVQLLEDTEKAVGDPQLPIQHSSLIEKSRELTNIEIAVKRNGETINQLKAQNAETEKDVEHVCKRDELLLKVELMMKKLPWLAYDIEKAEYVAAKEREKEAKMKSSEATGTLKDLREPIETKKQEKAVLDLDSKNAVNLMNANAKRRMHSWELQPEIMFLAASLLDRFLSKGFFSYKRKLQIVGIACLALATRIEENQLYNSVKKNQFSVGSEVYSRCEVAMEWLVQDVLQFQCFSPTIYNSLGFYIKAAGAGKEVEKRVKYLALLAIADHEHLGHWPSTVAASLVILAFIESNHNLAYRRVSEVHVGTNDNDLEECIQECNKEQEALIPLEQVARQKVAEVKAVVNSEKCREQFQRQFIRLENHRK